MIRAVTIAFGLLATLQAQRPDNVLVVVNENSSLSRTIAEYYALKRRIPKQNLCSIRTSTSETIDRATYQRDVAKPVAACLKSRGLAETILYIVTTSEVPLRVSGKGGKDGDNASVDSELTLLYGALRGWTFPVNGIVPNPFYRKVDAAFAHPEFPIYLVTRLAAYDFPGVRALIDRSLAARNRGVFVIDLKSITDTDGNAWLRDAAIRLPSDRLVFDESERVLYGVKDVIGYASWGSNDSARKERRPRFQWLPGAIMTEFVSSNARTFARPPAGWALSDWKSPKLWFAGTPQTLITDYLDEGATGAAGHIDEPYLVMTPRPDILLPAWYKGRTLAEAYYLAMPALSWQNVVVGDPLCTLGPPPK